MYEHRVCIMCKYPNSESKSDVPMLKHARTVVS